MMCFRLESYWRTYHLSQEAEGYHSDTSVCWLVFLESFQLFRKIVALRAKTVNDFHFSKVVKFKRII